MKLEDLRDLLEQALHPLRTRVVNMLARAVVQLVKDGTKLQTMQLGVLADEDTPDDTERVQQYGFSSVPLPGAEAIVLFPGGDRSHPIVIATDDRRYRPTGRLPGEVTLYTKDGLLIQLTAAGTVELGAAGLGPADGVVHGSGIDPWTGATYAALGSTSAVVKAKK